MDEVRRGILERRGRVACCFWVGGVWVEDVDEEVAVFDADHDLPWGE